MSLPHHKLVAWQRADDLFIDVHRLTHQFPRSEYARQALRCTGSCGTTACIAPHADW